MEGRSQGLKFSSPCVGTPHVAGEQPVQIAEAEAPQGGSKIGRQGIWSEEADWIIRQNPQPHLSVQQATSMLSSGYPEGRGPSARSKADSHSTFRENVDYPPSQSSPSTAAGRHQWPCNGSNRTAAAAARIGGCSATQATAQGMADPAGIAPPASKILDRCECAHSSYVLATVRYVDSWTCVRCRDMRVMNPASRFFLHQRGPHNHREPQQKLALADPGSSCQKAWSSIIRELVLQIAGLRLRFLYVWGQETEKHANRGVA